MPISLIAVLALANDFSLPVTATYQTGPPDPPTPRPSPCSTAGWRSSIALFLGLSALFHFIVASPAFSPRYEASLPQNRNIFRWVEYSLSSSIMVVVIAQLNGITEITALVAIFAVNASMILFGWLQEKFATPGDGEWLPFIFGCIAGSVPWLLFVFELDLPKGPAGATPPGFVYGIVASLFVLFNCFALVQSSSTGPRGRWADYLRGEKTYIVLSFVAKSALAWQIFASTLAVAN